MHAVARGSKKMFSGSHTPCRVSRRKGDLFPHENSFGDRWSFSVRHSYNGVEHPLTLVRPAAPAGDLMHRLRPFPFGLGLAALLGGIFPASSIAQDPPRLEPPDSLGSAHGPGRPHRPTHCRRRYLAPDPRRCCRRSSNRPVRPTAEGCRSWRSSPPPRTAPPVYVDKAPPNPINGAAARASTRPATRRSGFPATGNAELGPERLCLDHRHHGGTLRPVGSWVNSYWKRDDKGWYRVPGFWSDRQTDRIDWRKNGPPADSPADELRLPLPGTKILPTSRYAITRPTATASPWTKGYWAKAPAGPGRGFPPNGSASPKVGLSRKVTGTGPSKHRGTSVRPREGHRQRSGRRQHGHLVSPRLPGLLARAVWPDLWRVLGRPNSYYDGYPGYFYATG